jgi:hypothetical protein
LHCLLQLLLEVSFGEDLQHWHIVNRHVHAKHEERVGFLHDQVFDLGVDFLFPVLLEHEFSVQRHLGILAQDGMEHLKGGYLDLRDVYRCTIEQCLPHTVVLQLFYGIRLADQQFGQLEEDHEVENVQPEALEHGVWLVFERPEYQILVLQFVALFLDHC